MGGAQLSGKFPYRVVELLSPYISEATPLVKEKKAFHTVADFSAAKVIQREFSYALERQRGPRFPAEAKEKFLNNLTSLLDSYLQSLPPDQRLRDVMGLCQTVAFANRASPSETAETLKA
jgi:hypothetical protein